MKALNLRSVFQPRLLAWSIRKAIVGMGGCDEWEDRG